MGAPNVQPTPALSGRVEPRLQLVNLLRDDGALLKLLPQVSRHAKGAAEVGHGALLLGDGHRGRHDLIVQEMGQASIGLFAHAARVHGQGPFFGTVEDMGRL